MHINGKESVKRRRKREINVSSLPSEGEGRKKGTLRKRLNEKKVLSSSCLEFTGQLEKKGRGGGEGGGGGNRLWICN